MRVSRIFTSLLVILLFLGTYNYSRAADSPISGLTEDTKPASSDYVLTVDVSDTSMAATGTNKKVQVQNLVQGLASQTISGTTLAKNNRYFEIGTFFGHAGVSPFPTSSVSPYLKSGASIWAICPADGVLQEIHLVLESENTGYVQVWKANMRLPTSSDIITSSSGVSTIAGVTCFDGSPAASGASTFTAGDVVVFYLGPEMAGTTTQRLYVGLKILKD
uniref:Uncharacterized protein n=1 Tax=viral metagenome TaxID=1070528 RepID=A0A6M3J9Z6_9ZZZZ